MKAAFTAGHLPGLREEELAWQALSFGAGTQAVEVRMPVLTPAQLAGD